MDKKTNGVILWLVLISCFPALSETGYNAVKYVDPRIGSVHGRWFFFTPAAVPFGMAKLSTHTDEKTLPGKIETRGINNGLYFNYSTCGGGNTGNENRPFLYKFN